MQTSKVHYLILTTGFATFFFGFAAGAMYHVYLSSIGSPLVQEFRATLSFVSAIVGDGILLPVINMIALSFLLKSKVFLRKKIVLLSILLGTLVTVYFHVNQALNGLVNWSMPEPWKWNLLGLWHAIYMVSVASFLSLFYVVGVLKGIQNRKFFKELLFVTLGMLVFFILLRLDYSSVPVSQFFFR